MAVLEIREMKEPAMTEPSAETSAPLKDSEKTTEGSTSETKAAAQPIVAPRLDPNEGEDTDEEGQDENDVGLEYLYDNVGCPFQAKFDHCRLCVQEELQEEESGDEEFDGTRLFALSYVSHI